MSSSKHDGDNCTCLSAVHVKLDSFLDLWVCQTFLELQIAEHRLLRFNSRQLDLTLGADKLVQIGAERIVNQTQSRLRRYQLLKQLKVLRVESGNHISIWKGGKLHVDQCPE